MSVQDADLGDIYVDASGKLWRVIALCREPTVTVEEVEGRAPEAPSPYLSAVGMTNPELMNRPRFDIIKDRKGGAVSGAMWDGFKRIHRPAQGMAARSGETACGLDPKGNSPVAEGDAPT